MKLLCWNVNGIRAVQKKGFLEWFLNESADISSLQETKAQKDQLDRKKFVQDLGSKVQRPMFGAWEVRCWTLDAIPQMALDLADRRSHPRTPSQCESVR